MIPRYVFFMNLSNSGLIFYLFFCIIIVQSNDTMQEESEKVRTKEQSVFEFRVELADVPIEVRCRYEVNKRFLKDYITEKEPLFAAEPTDADLESARDDYDRLDQAEGREKIVRSGSFLENIALFRLIAERMPAYNVLLMHGSALSMDGEAYIFTAPSGTGKSTHARLWREMFGDRVWMINDDKPMLRFSENGVRVYGTPWNGKHSLSRNASAPLRAIAHLERGEENRIEPLAKKDAFPVVVGQALVSQDPVTMLRILTLEKRLLDSVAFYTLHCNMEPDAARIAYEGMKQVYPR